MSATTSAAFELDREKLRQWDLLSSACLLQEQQRGSMADSGRGLPTTERPGDVLDARSSAPGTTGTSTTATIDRARSPSAGHSAQGTRYRPTEFLGDDDGDDDDDVDDQGADPKTGAGGEGNV